MKDLKANREAWLRAAYALLRKELLPEAPEQVAVSWGFPSKGGTRRSKRRIGECHYKPGIGEPVEGDHVLIVSPTLSKPTALLETLLHEAVHTVAGPEAGHRAKFSRLAKRVGLKKPWTATTATPELLARFEGWLKSKLPAWPGGFLMVFPKEKTRQLKAVCECDPPRILRASKTVLEGGPIICGICEAEFNLDV